MIAPQELRLGNFVTLSEKLRQEMWDNQISACNEYFKVDVIYSDGDVVLELDYENVDFESKDIEPIELTEDWLIRMGFTVSGGWIYKFGVTESDVNDGVHYVLESNTIVIGNHNKLKYKIKYVHQIQNLFYSLCGEELKLKN